MMSSFADKLTATHSNKSLGVHAQSHNNIDELLDSSLAPVPVPVPVPGTNVQSGGEHNERRGISQKWMHCKQVFISVQCHLSHHSHLCC